VVPHGLSSGLEKDHSGDVVDGVVEEGLVAGIGGAEHRLPSSISADEHISIV
jgi:hypothetical protein